jgi:hypothetical protein
MNDVLVVMIHLFETMPDLSLGGINIRWKEFSDRLVEQAKSLEWPVVYQLDFIDRSCYNSSMNPLTEITEKSFGLRWSFFKQFGKLQPNSNLVLKDCDYLSTSDEETTMIIARHNPKIVLFGGLHKDRCVISAKQSDTDTLREYHVSDQLSYTWKETWQNS